VRDWGLIYNNQVCQLPTFSCAPALLKR